MADIENQYNLTVSPLWAVQENGNLQRKISNEDELLKTKEGLQQLIEDLEVGGKIVIKVLREESRKTENSPHAYLEYMSKERVEHFAAKFAAKREAQEVL